MSRAVRAAWLHALRHGHRHTDPAVAAILLAVVLITTVTDVAPSGPGPGLAEATAAAVACGSLVLRRRHPLLALALSTVAAEVYLALLRGEGGDLVLAAPLIALYTLAERTGRRPAIVVGGAVVFVLGAVHVAIKPDSWIGSENLALASLGALAVALGEASRTRRAYVAEVEERAQRAERDREVEARARVTEERLRLARELHDAVGHQLALVSVQAGVADHVLESSPEAAREALRHVRAASRDALAELHATVGLLRSDDAGGPSTPPAPTVGLAALPTLVAGLSGSGLDIDQRLDGGVRPLPPAIDLTAYRVIQEALTNASRHGSGTRVVLRVDYRPEEIEILVENPVRSGAAARGRADGHGITGMRERVTALGGTVTAGPDRHGSFRLRAVIPLPDEGAAR
ncbi:sensor histidine kinase [Nocardioides sp.]|uniref:sensor histidine kinase n=1 Tax=Nocardioides sp. TaxID=35761 RepID=UPI002EDAEB67